MGAGEAGALALQQVERRPVEPTVGLGQPLTQLEGFERAYFLTDSAAGRAMTVTLWDSPAAMAASAEWASKAREHAAHESGATVESVLSYEVALTAQKTALR